MAKARIEIDVPAETIVFDLGTRLLRCRVCGSHSHVHERAGDREGTFDEIFESFLNSHGRCILKKIEDDRQRAEAINATRGGPFDR